MTAILHVVSSPRAERSASRLLGEAVVEAYRAARPGTTVDTLDLWAEPIPAFDGDRVAAKMTVIGGGTPTGPEAAAWRSIEATVARFTAADLYVFGVPMWNGGIPWLLKQYVDTLTQPGLLFRFDPATGYHGLLRGRRAVAAYTSAVYRPGVAPAFGRDFHSTYFRDWLRSIGVDDTHELRFQPTFGTDDDLAARRAQALDEARRLARRLAAPAPSPAPSPAAEALPRR
jgi:FMN-dependent NADH-azoreductase